MYSGANATAKNLAFEDIENKVGGVSVLNVKGDYLYGGSGWSAVPAIYTPSATLSFLGGNKQALSIQNAFIPTTGESFGLDGHWVQTTKGTKNWSGVEEGIYKQLLKPGIVKDYWMSSICVSYDGGNTVSFEVRCVSSSEISSQVLYASYSSMMPSNVSGVGRLVPVVTLGI